MAENYQSGRISRKVMLEELSKITASDIMIPRSSVALINYKNSFTEIIDVVINDGHSRFPVFSEKIDNIIGILYVKDLLQYFKSVDIHFDLVNILRKPLFVSENKKASELLTEFREERVHIAIVVDEYGTMLGIVSLEDILEEIVGEISDEYDYEEQNQNFTIVSKDEYIINPRITLEEFNTIFKSKISSENYETLSGFIMDRFGYVPKEGETLQFGNLHFLIKNVEGSKIKHILVKKI